MLCSPLPLAGEGLGVRVYDSPSPLREKEWVERWFHRQVQPVTTPSNRGSVSENAGT